MFKQIEIELLTKMETKKGIADYLLLTISIKLELNNVKHAG